MAAMELVEMLCRAWRVRTRMRRRTQPRDSSTSRRWRRVPVQRAVDGLTGGGDDDADEAEDPVDERMNSICQYDTDVRLPYRVRSGMLSANVVLPEMAMLIPATRPKTESIRSVASYAQTLGRSASCVDRPAKHCERGDDGSHRLDKE